MKIILFLNEDIHAAAALEVMIPTLRNYDLQIILSKKVGRVDSLPDELQQMWKAEQVGAAEMFVGLARDLGAEIFSYENVNSENALADFRNFAPDLIVSIRFGQIFKQPLINIPRCGVINLHSGILPNYRGVLATFWAILNGDREIGITLHFISDAKIDEGEVIGISKVKVDFERPLISNINRLYEGGCALIVEAIKKISRGEKIETVKQSALGDGQYFSYPKVEEVKRFLEIMPLN